MDRKTLLKFGIIAVGGFVVAPFIFIAIQGIIGLMIAGGIALIAIALAPWASMKLSNLKLMAVKHEAAKNPVETMQILYQERKSSLEEFSRGIQSFSSRIGQFESQLGNFAKKFPERAPMFKEQLARMRLLKAQRLEQYRKANSDLEAYKTQIEEADAIWQMTQSANALNQAAGIRVDPLEEIKNKTALESVQLSMNESFAQLELMMVEAKEDPMLIDVTPPAQLVQR